METKNNSEFMSQVDAFSGEMQKFIEKSEGKHAVIIIASESDENGEGSRQTGYISWAFVCKTRYSASLCARVACGCRAMK